ncbi:TRAP transporter small permease subunit [Guyparkeria hydrothermalis]|uniref:TRAP transporter small permease subunit n=1 Tax=Guyparkeria hydrothermalis TaxID=923 RepID=UPI0020215698|nr:TRAP transporter small permease subunit [Guyparkeria hydrothermalis]MCL7743571.1 TRAP transporter small permease subunit [Guyparkeria hydrothermalis]
MKTAILELARSLDRGVGLIGRLSAWLTLGLVLLVAGNVLFRYVFHVSSVGLQELEWHLLALIAMLGSVYTLQQDEHVRVDVLWQRYPPRLRRAFGSVIAAAIIVPMALWLGWLSVDYVTKSFHMGEGSPDPGGLSHRFLVKAVIPVGFVLIAIQGLAMALRDAVAVFVPDPDAVFAPPRRTAGPVMPPEQPAPTQ